MRLGPRQKKWVEDIPKYVQAKDNLCDGKGFCCLGVYAHTQVEAPWNEDWSYTDSRYVRQDIGLAEEDYEALGLKTDSGGFNQKIRYKGIHYTSLALLNDSGHITPTEMAAFIFKHRDIIFTKSA
jgi:hypothetical protein